LKSIARDLEEMVTVGNKAKLPELLANSCKWRLRSFGGNPIRCSKLEELYGMDFEAWRESVVQKPACLPTSYSFAEFTSFFPTTRPEGNTTQTARTLNLKQNIEVKDAFNEVFQKKLEGSNCVVM